MTSEPPVRLSLSCCGAELEQVISFVAGGVRCGTAAQGRLAPKRVTQTKALDQGKSTEERLGSGLENLPSIVSPASLAWQVYSLDKSVAIQRRALNFEIQLHLPAAQLAQVLF